MRYYEHPPGPPSPLDRVQALAEHLTLLGSNVKEAVAEAVTETLARMARDAAERVLGQSLERPSPTYRYGYAQYHEHDPWEEAEEHYHQFEHESESTMQGTERAVVGRALAAGLAAAGWWLRRGQPWAGVAAGVAVAAAVAAGHRLGRTGKAVSNAVADLVVVAVPLARRSDQRHVS